MAKDRKRTISPTFSPMVHLKITTKAQHKWTQNNTLRIIQPTGSIVKRTRGQARQGRIVHKRLEDSQEEKEGQDPPKTQHHLQAFTTTLWNDSTGGQNDIDTVTQPEASITRKGCGSKHVVSPEFPHAGQQLHKPSEKQGKGDGNVRRRSSSPHGVGALCTEQRRNKAQAIQNKDYSEVKD